ncbi:MAG: hypothetical protein J6U92_00310 [Clostridia bacterium]|nr:hypothetical protein [Clostridia bacterium]
MKKLLRLLLLSLCLSFVFTTACTQQPDNSGSGDSSQQTSQTEYCTVTFVQTGYENIVKSVEKGKGILEADIPEPNPIDGYTVVWDKTDFSVVNENLTVNAVATPNEYSIYLVYNAPESQKEVVSETLPTEIKVKYGEIPTMPTYQNNGYVIVGWVYEDGTPYTVNEYKTLGNTTVKAQWEYWTGK